MGVELLALKQHYIKINSSWRFLFLKIRKTKEVFFGSKNIFFGQKIDIENTQFKRFGRMTS
jgi:hypothetical protein